MNKNCRKGVALVAGLILGWVGTGVAEASPPPLKAVTVHILPQPLREALRVFAEQTQLQVVYRSEQIDPTIISAAVEGTYSPEEALTKLLGTAELRAVRINSRTLAIHLALDRSSRKGGVVRASTSHSESTDHE